MAGPIRVLVVDDHPVVRRGLIGLLTSWGDIEVVAEAADGNAAVREAQLTRPDVVLMDIRMPGIDGLEATRRIRAAVPGAAVLILTMAEDDETLFAAMRAGGRSRPRGRGGAPRPDDARLVTASGSIGAGRVGGSVVPA